MRTKQRLGAGNELFFESHAAAKSLKNFWTRMASTYKCMYVLLSEESLIIRPHWYAGCMIYLLRLDLDHEIPVGEIRAVKRVGKWLGYGMVEVIFKTSDFQEKKILLYLRNDSEFVEKVRALIQP